MLTSVNQCSLIRFIRKGDMWLTGQKKKKKNCIFQAKKNLSIKFMTGYKIIKLKFHQKIEKSSN